MHTIGAFTHTSECRILETFEIFSSTECSGSALPFE